MNNTELKQNLKNLIIEVCNLCALDISCDMIEDDDLLIGPGSKFGLDSIDALEIVVAIEKKYKVRIGGANFARKIIKTINTIADFVQNS